MGIGIDTPEEIEKAEQDWEQDKAIQERKYNLRDDKINFKKSHKRKISTSKILIAFLFLNCTLIEIFTGYITLQSIHLAEITLVSPDFTPLVTLIGAIISEVIGYAVYSLKAMRENTSTSGVFYEMKMAEQQEDFDTENEVYG